MTTAKKFLLALVLSVGFHQGTAFAQTDGSAKLDVTVLDYNGNSTKHWAVAWVTTGSGTFIKTLWKQGPANFPSHYGSHLGTWNTARAGSTVVDGYTSATAANYVAPNDPINPTWNCRNASNVLVPDGDYRFWVQYAEDSGQGPVTTGGLLWTKGAAGATNTYPNQGANFSNMKVTWTPSTPATVAPTITSAALPGTGQVGTAYNHTVTATGTAPITFSATGLPDGVTINPTSGAVSGTPTTAGTFTGSITAANGTLPNATQAFSVVISAAAPVAFVSVGLESAGLVVGGTGPANGVYHVLSTTDPTLPIAQWTVAATNSIDGSGGFRFTNTVDAGVMQRYYRLRLP